jgi:MoaA/NifB/PqqE/SkfB family radical SAM enzyme
VHLSLLGSPEKHDELVGMEGFFKHLDESIQRLKSIKSDRIIIGVEHMVSESNRGQYRWVAGYAHKNRIGVTYTIEQSAGYYQNNNKRISKVEYPPITASFSLIDIFKNGYLRGKRVKCVAGDYSCFIMPDKNVYPCMFAIPQSPAYNLKSSNYHLNTMVGNEFVKDCGGCWTPCETYSALVFRPWRILW